MNISDNIVNEIKGLFSDLTAEINISREGSYIAYTEDYDLWFADRFLVSGLDREFYIWIKDNSWGIVEQN